MGSPVDVVEPDGPWSMVAVTVDPELAELASGLLWAHGAAGIEERETSDGLLLLAGCPDRATADDAAEAVRALARRVTVDEVVDDGLDAWRASAVTVQAGPFVLHPAWLPLPPADPTRHLMVLEPGRTFGSGSHPTSRLVLQVVGRDLTAGDRVLDVGCGSGILSIGAALLGAGQVVAIDIDPNAPAATTANAAANGVAHLVRASPAPLAEVVAEYPPFDLVLANLLAPAIRELAADLVRAVGSTGRLVVSGLLADRWEDAVAHLAPLRVETVDLDQGWAAVTLVPHDAESP